MKTSAWVVIAVTACGSGPPRASPPGPAAVDTAVAATDPDRNPGLLREPSTCDKLAMVVEAAAKNFDTIAGDVVGVGETWTSRAGTVQLSDTPCEASSSDIARYTCTVAVAEDSASLDDDFASWGDTIEGCPGGEVVNEERLGDVARTFHLSSGVELRIVLLMPGYREFRIDLIVCAEACAPEQRSSSSRAGEVERP